MSTREKAISLIDSLPDEYVEQLNIVLSNPYMLEELFNLYSEFNDDTIEAIEEGRKIACDSNVKGYDNIKDLRAALGV